MKSLRAAFAFAVPPVAVMLVAVFSIADESKPNPAPPASEKAAEEDAVLKPRGRPEGKDLDVPARYYVWTDDDGWHLRTAARRMTRFEGVIRLKQGSFEKLRAIGLESKGKSPDAWTVNKDRTEIKFDINTAGSFDGFDFTSKNPKDTIVGFELQVAGKSQPQKIFVGKGNAHPPEATFEFPAGTD
jgi:hypothetical protein